VVSRRRVIECCSFTSHVRSGANCDETYSSRYKGAPIPADTYVDPDSKVSCFFVGNRAERSRCPLGFLRRVACQVLPLMRLGEGAQAPDAPIDKFRDWQENTNSIFCSRPLAAGLRQQMEVWFYLNEEPRPRGQHTRRRIRKDLYPRSSEARRESFCPLDKDLSWKSDNRKLGKSTFPWLVPDIRVANKWFHLEAATVRVCRDGS